MKQAVRLFGRSVGTYVVTLFLALIVLTGVGTSPKWLQILLDVVLLGGMFYMLFADGGYRGERACTMSATAERRRGEGQPVPDDMQRDCFSKKAALISYALIAAPLLIVSVVNIAAAPMFPPVIIEDYEELPAEEMSVDELVEKSSAMTEEEIAAAQAESDKALSETNYVNVASRVVFMPLFSVYSFFNRNPDGLNLIFVLFSLIVPVPAIAGYLSGPVMRLKKLKDIETGKKRKLKKLKVHQKKREVKPPKMEV